MQQRVVNSRGQGVYTYYSTYACPYDRLCKDANAKATNTRHDAKIRAGTNTDRPQTHIAFFACGQQRTQSREGLSATSTTTQHLIRRPDRPWSLQLNQPSIRHPF